MARFPLEDDAVELLIGMSARKAGQAIEVAYPFTLIASRTTKAASDVRRGVELVHGGRSRRPMGFTS